MSFSRFLLSTERVGPNTVCVSTKNSSLSSLWSKSTPKQNELQKQTKGEIIEKQNHHGHGLAITTPQKHIWVARADSNYDESTNQTRKIINNQEFPLSVLLQKDSSGYLTNSLFIVAFFYTNWKEKRIKNAEKRKKTINIFKRISSRKEF